MNNEQPVRSFYRVVKKNPPTDRDYVSRQERQGDPPANATEDERRSWDALSFFDTEDGARQMALQIPALGKFVAR